MKMKSRLLQFLAICICLGLIIVSVPVAIADSVPSFPVGGYNAIEDSSFVNAWSNTASYDSANEVVHVNKTTASNKNAYCGFDIPFCNQNHYYATAQIDFQNDLVFGGSRQRNFSFLIAKDENNVALKVIFRPEYNQLLLSAASPNSGTVSFGGSSSLAGVKFTDIYTHTSSEPAYHSLSSVTLTQNTDDIYDCAIDYDGDNRRVKFWVNGSLLINTSFATWGTLSGTMTPIFGMLSQTFDNSLVATAVDVKDLRIWGDGISSTIITTPSISFLRDSSNSSVAQDGTIDLNSKVSTLGTSDVAWLSGFDFLDADNFTVEADVTYLSKFNPDNYNNSKIGIIFGGTDNFNNICEIGVRPENNGQCGILGYKLVDNIYSIGSDFWDTNGSDRGCYSGSLANYSSYSYDDSDPASSGCLQTVTFTFTYSNGNVSFSIGDHNVFNNAAISTSANFEPTVAFLAYNCHVQISNIGIRKALPSKIVTKDRILRTDAEFDEDNIAFKVGVLSDPHLSYATYTADQIKNAIEQYTRGISVLKSASANSLDAIMMLGDYTSNGNAIQAETFTNATNAALTSIFGVSRPELAITLGNHDSDWGGCMTAGEWDTVLEAAGLRNSTYAAGCPDGCYHLTITKGGVTYHILDVETDVYNLNGATNVFTTEVLDWLDTTLNTITASDSTHYIYVGTHGPVAESGIFGTDYDLEKCALWGTAKAYKKGYNSNIHAILSKYPQVVLMSGHTHFSEYPETTIMQDNYTAINVCAAAGKSLSSESSSYYIEGGYENTGAKGGMGLLIEVDNDGNQRITRLDFSLSDSTVTFDEYETETVDSFLKATNVELTVTDNTTDCQFSDAWITPACTSNKNHLQYYSDVRGDVSAPVFAGGAAIESEGYLSTDESGPHLDLTVSFPAAVSSVYILQYRINVLNESGDPLMLTHRNVTPETNTLWAYGNWNGSTAGVVTGTNHFDATEFSYSGITALDAGEHYTVVITPVDEYGNIGTPLSRSFDAICMDEPVISESDTNCAAGAVTKSSGNLNKYTDDINFDVVSNATNNYTSRQVVYFNDATEFAGKYGFSLGNSNSYSVSATVTFDKLYESGGSGNEYPGTGTQSLAGVGFILARNGNASVQILIRAAGGSRIQQIILMVTDSSGNSQFYNPAGGQVIQQKGTITKGESFRYAAKWNQETGCISFWLNGDLIIGNACITGAANYDAGLKPAFGISANNCAATVSDVSVWGNGASISNRFSGSDVYDVMDGILFDSCSYDYNGDSSFNIRDMVYVKKMAVLLSN